MWYEYAGSRIFFSYSLYSRDWSIGFSISKQGFGVELLLLDFYFYWQAQPYGEDYPYNYGL